MTRRSLLSTLLALVLPKQPPERYLFRLVSVDVPDDLWTRRVVYKIKQTWTFKAGDIRWSFKPGAVRFYPHTPQ